MIPAEAYVHLCYCTITIKCLFDLLCRINNAYFFTDIAPRDQTGLAKETSSLVTVYDNAQKNARTVLDLKCSNGRKTKFPFCLTVSSQTEI